METTKSYELPLTRDYVRNWTSVEAIREILQNALDYGRGTLSCIIDETCIQIDSLGARLEPRALLLGCTSKADDVAAIGSFGEGYKIALLVLAREGVKVEVRNCGVTWLPRFALSESFGEEVLIIDEIVNSKRATQGVSFVISGLAEGVTAKVKANTLQLQGDIGLCHRVPQGEVLLEQPGKLYVNGLFISDTGLEFGYNVKPEFIKLERDRQTVSRFDLKWLTKDMWFSANVPSNVAEMMEKGVEDLEYANYNCPELVKEACYKAFVEKHPGAVVAKSQAELDKIIEERMVKEVRVYNSSYVDVIRSHEDYKEPVLKKAVVTPQMYMKAFLAAQRVNMNRKSITAFKEIIEASKNWK
jgi:hypothetical protein